MEIKILGGNITKSKADAIIIGYFQKEEPLSNETSAVDRQLEGAISQLIKQREIKGELNEMTSIFTLSKLSAERVVVVGLGKTNELTVDRVRAATAETCRTLGKKGAGRVAIVPLGAGINSINPRASAQAICEGALLGTYDFRRYKTQETEFRTINELTIVAADNSQIPLMKEGSRIGRIAAEATNLTRDMVNEPAGYKTPSRIADIAADIAKKHGLVFEVLEREQMQKLGMGGLLGVSQGSVQPPKFIILRYKGTDADDIHLALVGKGITFDSGGISLKNPEGMWEMKGDMAGGATAIAVLSAIAQLKPRINILALVPTTENMPSGSAQKPGDIVTMMNGKTVEVINTDAEGRLILADALSYAVKQGAKRIVDIATLTGAMQIALGSVCTGIFGNDQELTDQVIAAGAEAGELIWQMPLYEQYKEQIKSDVADIKNSGGRYGGAITAAQFLANFVGDTPWAHLDIAGTNMSDKEKNYTVKGATGVMVRTLINLALVLASSN